jgi:poly-gamma-glutamate system protein
MYKPSLKSTWTLAILALVAYAMYFLAEHSRIPVRQKYYEEKLAAARLMQEAISTIRDFRIPHGVVVDEVNDPDQTALIGQQYTLITSSEGKLDAKLTSVNPNFAAVMVDIFREAGLHKGEQVAMGITGSFPAMNIAALCACKVLELEPVIITSVASSWWGANDPECTWLDMERLLREKGILPYKSIAATMGGGSDIGRSLSPEGRRLLLEAMKRNDVPLLEAADLNEDINKRYQLYMEHLGPAGYGIYVNIGGGVASLGHAENGNLIPTGLSHNITMANYPRKGVIHRFAEHGIPVANIKHIETLARRYGLPVAPEQVPEVGTGQIFVRLQYDLRLAWLGIIVVSLLVGIVMKIDFTNFRLAEEGTDPDEL